MGWCKSMHLLKIEKVLHLYISSSMSYCKGLAFSSGKFSPTTFFCFHLNYKSGFKSFFSYFYPLLCSIRSHSITYIKCCSWFCLHNKKHFKGHVEMVYFILLTVMELRGWKAVGSNQAKQDFHRNRCFNMFKYWILLFHFKWSLAGLYY